jgi:hypothetical protein
MTSTSKAKSESNADPGVKARRRISFGSANLIGSPQDDVKCKGRGKSRVTNKVKDEIKRNIKTESESEG